jgi:hypothetical protein
MHSYRSVFLLRLFPFVVLSRVGVSLHSENAVPKSDGTAPAIQTKVLVVVASEYRHRRHGLRRRRDARNSAARQQRDCRDSGEVVYGIQMMLATSEGSARPVCSC